jgi:sugar lactone lactonase YvrE
MTAKVPGLRTGAVLFADGSGNPLSTVPLYGVGLAPQVGFQTAAPVLLASGLNEPLGLRVDSAGNTYIADAQNARVLVVAPGGTQSTIGTGFAAPADVVLDGAGNFYVSDIGNQVVYKIAPSGTQTTAVSGLSFPYGLSLDGAGNLYISEALDGILLKVSPGGVRTLVASGLGMNYTNAVDVAGNVYTGDFTSGNIYKISPGGVQTTIGNLTNVTGLALDAAGDLYADSFGSGTISRIPPGGVPETIVSGLTGPYGITMDTTGNLFITEYLANTANKLSLTTSPVLNFATTAGGGTSSDSPMAATVVNIGNAPLVFSSVLYPADFPKDAAGNATACTGTTMLAPALTCTLTVDFKPVSLSGTSTSLALSEQATFKSNNLNLTGIGGHLVLTGTETKLIPTVMLSAAMKTVGTTSELALTARATGSGPVPGGLVTFQAGGVTVGTATLTPTGAAVLTTARPTLRHTFTAITAGDAVYASGKSNGVVINPTDASPAVVLSSSANPASKGSLVTFTATVSTAISGVPPTGNVQFTISGAVLATVSVSGGQASYSTSSLGVGSHTVVATYLGDANYLPTASNSVKQSITPTN